MTLWWIGDLVLIVVVLPVVVAILIQVLTPLFQIRAYVEDITAYGANFNPHLDEIAAELLKTRELVKAGGGEVVRLSRAIDTL